ncbi:YuiA family protein [Brevibacillus choshinensis]|uniref:YuiA family protein n=1 Tax=Brevibacillus choshinensis TaxID=54911 RepID=A0ABX7FKS7_BRECH|nr:YuiA family protein [Brevibacillus choshinensis]QRG66823.1 YuiA family protein [Brevibacillus choshinensis]
MRSKQEQCPYCEGQGYFQLLLGGTENCPNCEGSGTHHQQEPVSASKKY